VRLAASNIVGIALADRTITCVEVGVRGGSGGADREERVVRNAATMTLAPGHSIENPEALGQALRAFLRENGFGGSSRAVVGVPAKWLIAVEKDVPPASETQVRAVLRLQAERMSVAVPNATNRAGAPVAEGSEMVFDYVADADAGGGGPRRVLLVGMLRKQLDRIRIAMESAGLSVVAVTPVALALASVARHSGAGAGSLVVVAGHGAELVWHGGGGGGGGNGAPRVLRHVSAVVSNGHGTPSVALLGSELRRTVAMAQATSMPTAPLATGAGGSGAGGSGGELSHGHQAPQPLQPQANEMLLFDSVGLSQTQVCELSDRMGVTLRVPQGLSALRVRTVNGQDAGAASNNVDRYAPAAALALVGSKRHRNLLPLDFSHSRLAPPPQRSIGRRTLWLGGIGAVIVLLVAGLFVHANLLERELNGINAGRKAIDDRYKIAHAVKDRVDFSNGFFRTRTPMLECLREVTEAFRDDEPIWATSFNIGEDRDSKVMGKALGRLEGRTTNMGIALALADRLRANPSFSNVSVRDVSEAGGRQRDQASFSITFSYTVHP
jgi:hypothetical protein